MNVERGRASGGAVERELGVRCKDGRYVSVLAQATSIASADGRGVLTASST